MPTLVKRHFPDRIGTMTATYTTCLAIGIDRGGRPVAYRSRTPFGSWRWGIGAWAVLTALAVLPWLPTLARDRPGAAGRDGPAADHPARPHETRLGAWC